MSSLSSKVPGPPERKQKGRKREFKKELKKILDAGGFDALTEKIKNENLTVSALNATYLNEKNYPYPEGDELEKIWSELIPKEKVII